MPKSRVASAHKPEFRTIVEGHGLSKHCPRCGYVGLKIADYKENDTGILVTWACPKCGMGKEDASAKSS